MRALHAEWTKVRTSPGTVWLLLALGLVIVAVGAIAAAGVGCAAPGCPVDTARISLTGVQVGQAVVAILAVLAMGGEYSNGLIRTTLTALPRRWDVLVAKAAVVVVLVAVTGAVAVPATAAVGRFILTDRGMLRLGEDSLPRAMLGSVLYLLLIAVLSLGVAAATRDSATAIGVVLGLLYVLPIVAQAVDDPEWQERLLRLAPMSAGLSIQATTDLVSLPIGPWPGLGVLAAWAMAAIAIGGGVLLRRDA